MTTVVISQPMLFPWVGMFEQIRLADVYVHLDDVPFSKGSFTNRVQLKGPGGPSWMTIPLADHHLGQTIRALRADDRQPWRMRHLQLLEQHYRDAPYVQDAVALVERVYAGRDFSVCELLMRSMEAVRGYFGLIPEQRQLVASRDLAVHDTGSARVLEIVRALGGSRYVTGHGARKYLDHAAFEAAGVQVAYLDYRCVPYPQLHGAFTPYVSTLDLIANLGPAGRSQFLSPAVDWKEFLVHV